MSEFLSEPRNDLAILWRWYCKKYFAQLNALALLFHPETREIDLCEVCDKKVKQNCIFLQLINFAMGTQDKMFFHFTGIWILRFIYLLPKRKQQHCWQSNNH